MRLCTAPREMEETAWSLPSLQLRLLWQQRLRENRELIPRFIEETLRLESPIKGAFRLAPKQQVAGSRIVLVDDVNVAAA